MPNELAQQLAAIRRVDVSMEGKPVGTLAQSAQGTIMFQYAPEWLASGFSISPFSLPLQNNVFEAKPDMPDGIFGVFRDSLPDDWGRLLQDRRLAALGVRSGSLSTLARLALIGTSGLGALEYAPAQTLAGSSRLEGDWDVLSRQCQDIVDDAGNDGLDAVYVHGSSSGGARPKVMVDFDHASWIVKFPASADGPNTGANEYRLSLMAKACGIVVPDTMLIPSRLCGGFFATKRFDRAWDAVGKPRKLHMASAAALLEVSPLDVLDYRDIMHLTFELTHSAVDCEQLFRVMCFNVAIGNCDDHARNFSYLYEKGSWHLSPAYDLTHDEGFLGEHATLINGRGTDIQEADLLSVGLVGGISPRKGREILRKIKDLTSQETGEA